MATYSQETRLGQLKTALEDDKLVLLEFSGTESVNEIGMFRVKAMSESPINPDELLGTAMKLVFKTISGKDRTFNLTVFSSTYLGKDFDADKPAFIYEFELRPWAWVMSKRKMSRVFHNKTTLDVLNEVMQSYSSIECYGFNDQSGLLNELIEYVVQYNESDLDFVRRLLEKAGANFHFDMSGSAQTFLVTSGPESFPNAGDIPYRSVKGQNVTNTEHFSGWAAERRVTTGAVRMMDYNFKTPTANMEATQSDTKSYSMSGLESFEYPGRYPDKGKGDKISLRRLQAARAGDAMSRAQGDCMSLGAGMKFKLSEADDGIEMGDYVVLSATHYFNQGSYRSGGNSRPPTYQGTFSVSSAALPVAPQIVTHRPPIIGIHTGMVVKGADNEVDEYGRIVVQMPWAQGAPTMKCRVAQMWAGDNWGTVFIPRTGMEVVVQFENGDPDFPVVTGCLYNARTMPPYSLPGEKTKSGFKSQSIGGSGYNELIFEDKAGSEMIRIHGQKDLDVTILNNETHTIKNDSTRSIIGNRKDTISKNLDLTVKQNQTTTVQQNRTITVTQEDKKTVTGKVVVESTTSIELKCGASKILIEPAKITLTSVEIQIGATGMLKTNGSAMAEHTAGGILAVKAPMVMINT